MSRFTKALRQKIVQEFAIRHNGTYNPTLFVAEVRKVGPSHPAYEWFEWDRDKAAQQYQVEQAREFARDLRVSFTVSVVNGGKRSVKVRETAMPLVISPMEGRKNGGGYLLVDTNDPAYMREHRLQGAAALRAWLGRYTAAAENAGASLAAIYDTIAALEAEASAAGRAA